MLQLPEFLTYLGQLNTTPTCLQRGGGHLHKECPVQNAPLEENLPGSVLSSRYTTTIISFSAAVRRNQQPMLPGQQQSQTHQAQMRTRKNEGPDSNTTTHCRGTKSVSPGARYQEYLSG